MIKYADILSNLHGKRKAEREEHIRREREFFEAAADERGVPFKICRWPDDDPFEQDYKSPAQPVKFHGTFYGERIEGDDIPEELLKDAAFLSACYSNPVSIEQMSMPSRMKCLYCGHWGEPKTECHHCGAPMPSDEAWERRPLVWWTK